MMFSRVDSSFYSRYLFVADERVKNITILLIKVYLQERGRAEELISVSFSREEIRNTRSFISTQYRCERFNNSSETRVI